MITFSNNNIYRSDIDGLRGIAVLLVVLFHGFPTLIPGGFIGVDVFFVISGFLISRIIYQDLYLNKFSFLSFYIRRINRIFPSLLLILLFVLIFGWCVFIPEDYEKLVKHIFSGALFQSNIVSLSEFGYFDDASELKPLLHLWSLAIEEQFYIIWPLFLILAWKFRINIFLLILFILISSFTLNLYRSSYDPSFAFFTLQCRAWELLAGALLSYINFIYRSNPTSFSKQLSVFTSFFGLIILAIGSVLISKAYVYPNWLALFPVIATVLIINSHPKSYFNKIFLSSPPFIFIGLISYPLYLWHWVLLSIAVIVLNENPSVYFRIVLIFISFILSWLTYKFFEIPIRKNHNNKFTAIILSVLVIVIASTSFLFLKQRGFVGQSLRSPLIQNSAIYPCGDYFKKNQLCIFGNLNSDKTILVYGDSHAEHLTTALNEAFGHQYKIVFSYFPSCFFNQHGSFNSNSNKCQPFLDLISSLKGTKIDFVIRSQRWHGYPSLKSDSEFDRSILDAAAAFDLNPSKIIIIGSTPDADIKCSKWNYYFGDSSNHKICKTNTLILEENKRFIKRTQNLKLPNNVFFIYPMSKLCKDDMCKVISEDTLYYSDVNHLTKDGAMLIMPELAQILNK